LEIFQPYRIIPVGSHCDHQNGIVTGIIIDKGINITFNPEEQNNCNNIFTIDSDIIGKIEYNPTNQPQNLIEHACYYMHNNFNVNSFNCKITSDYSFGGLASSSALIIAIIKTFDVIYNFSFDKQTLAMHALSIEYANGKKYGNVDPYLLMLGTPNNLCVIDCLDMSYQNIEIPFEYSVEVVKLPEREIIYDDKAQEMFNIAKELGYKTLREIPEEIISKNKEGVVKHFFNEQNRIQPLINSIKTNNKNLFLELTKQSGYSSIYDYGIGNIEDYNQHLSGKFGRHCCTKNNIFIIN
jgi:galactokinase